MVKTDRASGQSAMDTAVRLLTRRRHTRGELAKKLMDRGFGRSVVDSTLDKCEALDYIDDAATADAYIDELKAKGYGPRHVRRAMARKGLAPALIDAVVARRYAADAERAVAEQCITKKAAVFRRETDRWKRKQKMYRYLHGRGFSPAVISAVVADVDPHNS